MTLVTNNEMVKLREARKPVGVPPPSEGGGFLWRLWDTVNLQCLSTFRKIIDVISSNKYRCSVCELKTCRSTSIYLSISVYICLYLSISAPQNLRIHWHICLYLIRLFVILIPLFVILAPSVCDLGSLCLWSWLPLAPSGSLCL